MPPFGASPAAVGTPVRGAVLVLAWLLLGACSAPAAPEAAPPATTQPPAPPAACLLDLPSLDAATGLTWTVDEVTASDRRCVYDPQGSDGAFVVVEVEVSTTDLDAVAQICADGTRTATDTGFGCRLASGGVFAAQGDGDRLVTLAAAEIPEGTTAERLATAFAAPAR